MSSRASIIASLLFAIGGDVVAWAKSVVVIAAIFGP